MEDGEAAPLPSVLEELAGLTVERTEKVSAGHDCGQAAPLGWH